jgi:hypothetical protein
MPFKSWEEVDRLLAEATAPATNEQKELGRYAAAAIPRDIPRLVAAVVLRQALGDALHLPAPRPLSERYSALLRILRRPSDPQIEPQNDDDAEAWVTHLRLLRRRECLSRLKVDEGDLVKTMADEVAEVSSIGDDGRLYFRGGRGFGAWPDQVEIVVRSSDNSYAAKEQRRQTGNIAARRSALSDWSFAKKNDLADFNITSYVSNEDITALEEVVNLAHDEKPIQEFLRETRHLLTAILTGTDRFCLPQKRLGAEYVPDFIIGDADSLGIRWVLIELETPRSGVYKKDGSLDRNARKGVAQIMNWRTWLADNIAYARKRRAENGLGLFDIRENSDAIVLVGRRARMRNTKDAQRQQYRQSNIHIHTYDWLLECLTGAIHHQGPPASNPFLFASP